VTAATAPSRETDGDLLTVDEEQSLARRIAAGDVEARNELAGRNLGLVRFAIRKFAARHDPRRYDDLEGDLLLSLVRCAGRYRPDAGARFGTFAVARLSGEVKSHLRHEIRFRQRHCQLDELGLTNDDDRPRPSRALDTDNGEAVAKQDHIRHVSELLACLPIADRKLIEAHYGLAGHEPRTMQQLADRTGLTLNQVRTRLRGALARMRVVHLLDRIPPPFSWLLEEFIGLDGRTGSRITALARQWNCERYEMSAFVREAIRQLRELERAEADGRLDEYARFPADADLAESPIT
jgi:RNA polymerase sigma factor (sigma-70 family)